MGEASGFVSLGCEHILLSASLGLLSVAGIKILTESISGEERDLQGIVHQRSRGRNQSRDRDGVLLPPGLFFMAHSAWSSCLGAALSSVG